ncbi:unnamed protein product [Adineta ricciae]|uniref:Uncharacterized protein n=1 Tax=Adineta ricciae TaxID=249248 RepID=A0A816FK76_ADIRI|nr:unnamed protein product [Adineta ricciae]
MLDPIGSHRIRQNPIGFLETELHWNPTRKIPSKIQEIHVSDPTWDSIGSETVGIQCDSVTRISSDPPNSWDCSTWVAIVIWCLFQHCRSTAVEIGVVDEPSAYSIDTPASAKKSPEKNKDGYKV